MANCNNCGCKLEKGENNICYGCKEDLASHEAEIKLKGEKKEREFPPSPRPLIKGTEGI